MKSFARNLLGMLSLGILLAEPAEAQWRTQTIQLEPGWNSVFLEVDAYPSSCQLQFDNLPINAVWTWSPSFSTVQFIQNPDELVPETPDFRVYYPSDQARSLLSNLVALQAGRPYLIEASASATWTVKGRPLLIEQTWVPDSYNLVGFWTDPNSPPSFSQWFASSAAHNPLDVWSLDPDGTWTQIANSSGTPIQPGRAYWVFCAGASSFQGPVEIDLADRLLRFPRGLLTQDLGFRDRRFGTNRNLVVEVSPSESVPVENPEETSDLLSPLAGPIPLTYYTMVENASSYFDYVPLPATVPFTAEDTGVMPVEIGVDRMAMNPASEDAIYQSLLTIRNGSGFRRFVGVTAEGMETAPGGRKGLNKGGTPPNPYAGLWVGAVELSKVSEPLVNPPVMTETPTPFTFRFMCHVDAGGVARLLSEVNLFWRNGTLVTNPSTGVSTVGESGRFILLTATAPQSLLNELGNTVIPASIRDGRPFSGRASSLAYTLLDANGEPIEPTINFTNGSFGATGAVGNVNLTLTDTNPLNPFHHQYNPQHAYPAQGQRPFQSADFTIEREISLTFLAADPGDPVTFGIGDNEVVGTYRETLHGLRREGGAVPPVVTEGIFRLSRASSVAVLNDGM